MTEPSDWAPPTPPAGGGEDWAPPSFPAGAGPPGPPPEAPATSGPLANPWILAALAFGASALVSVVLFDLLAIPANILTDVFGDDSKNCAASGHRTGTDGMFWCSARVALWRVVGPIIVAVAALVFRRPLRKAVGRLRPKIPPQGRFLISPLLATSLFTMAFASIHSDTADASGYLPQRVFPAVVGLLTYSMPIAGRLLTRRVPGFFAGRDRVPMPLRLVVAIGVPFLLAYLTTRSTTSDLSNSEHQEQRTILLSIGLAWLALVPRGGNFANVMRGTGRFRRFV